MPIYEYQCLDCGKVNEVLVEQKALSSTFYVTTARAEISEKWCHHQQPCSRGSLPLTGRPAAEKMSAAISHRALMAASAEGSRLI
ncbi:MAG: FmdB family zinc ribbon protein [Candidatus Aminicenantales bacterium]